MSETFLLRARGEDRKRWADALRRFPRSDIYYTPGYALCYEGRGEGEAAAVLFVDGTDAVIHPVMLRRLRDLRWAAGLGWADGLHDVVTPYGYGGPLASVEEPKRRRTLLEAFDAAQDRLFAGIGVVSEFVRFHPLLATQEGFEGRMDLVRRGRTVWLELTDSEEGLFAVMNPKARNKIRRARREGVTAGVETGTGAVRTLTAIYTETMGRLGAPASYFFPESYFAALVAMPGQAAEIIVARHGERPLWAGVFMRHGPYLHYHLSGTSGDSRIPGVNNLALLEASVLGAQRGARIFHLGGGFGSKEDDLFAFKAGVGDRRAEFWTGARVHDGAAYERLCEARREGTGGGAPLDGHYFPAYRTP